VKTFKIGGVHPAENKLSAAQSIKVAEKSAESKPVAAPKEVNHEAPLPAAMQILLGGK
jgi:hypothetical protein